MAFPGDLLELAQDLVGMHPQSPHQASLRRAVSTAYYAIFHLLISETTANWARPELRATLGRCFDHGPMKAASEAKVSQINTAFKDTPPEDAEKTVAIHLRTVANAFIQAQQRRNDADYNMAKEWTPVEVHTQIDSVSEAFKAWNRIRDEASAQAYLVSLLGAKERRPNEPRQPATKRKRKRLDPESPATSPGSWDGLEKQTPGSPTRPLYDQTT
jgi:hypothetical protein